MFRTALIVVATLSAVYVFANVTPRPEARARASQVRADLEASKDLREARHSIAVKLEQAAKSVDVSAGVRK